MKKAYKRAKFPWLKNKIRTAEGVKIKKIDSSFFKTDTRLHTKVWCFSLSFFPLPFKRLAQRTMNGKKSNYRKRTIRASEVRFLPGFNHLRLLFPLLPSTSGVRKTVFDRKQLQDSRKLISFKLPPSHQQIIKTLFFFFASKWNGWQLDFNKDIDNYFL